MSGTFRVEVPARAGLVGNPSDGFGGATVAFTIDRLTAVIEACASEVVGLEADGARITFADTAALVAAGRAGNYPPGGPLALLMAASKRFCERGGGAERRLEGPGFELALSASSIPPRVGLAGSSAIVVGALRALSALAGHEYDHAELAAAALACETDELGIPAGLQDRVVQAYGGLVFMDFDPGHPAGGRFEPLAPSLLPPLFVAWLGGAETDSGRTHQTVRERFDRGDREVVEAMAEIGQLARAGRDALERRDHEALGALMTRNLELRKQIYTLDPRHERLVETARELGLPANYTGSGGAIVALRGDHTIDELEQAFTPIGAQILPI